MSEHNKVFFMISFFSDRDPKNVLKHLNALGDKIEIINIFPVGLKTMVFYQDKEVLLKDERPKKKEKTEET